MRTTRALLKRNVFQGRPTIFAAVGTWILSIAVSVLLLGCQSRPDINGPRPTNANEENLRVTLQKAESRPDFQVEEQGPFTDTYEFSGDGGCSTGKHTVTAPTKERLKMKVCWRLAHARLNNGCAEAERREHFMKICPSPL